MKLAISFPVQIKTSKVSSGAAQVIYYPQIPKLMDVSFGKQMNEAIVKQVQQLMEKQVGNMPSAVAEMLGTYEIKNNQRDVLSLSLSNYTYFDQAAHGMTYISSLTFDLKNRTQVQLGDLFKQKSNYVERLSTIIRRKIRDRNIIVLNDFKNIRVNQDFYVADKTLVIYFQLYELTAYAYGFPMFPISIYEIDDMIEDDSLLGRMAAHN